MKPTQFTNLFNIILLVIFMSLVAPNANAQNDEQKNSLKEDIWALQFQIGDNFSLKAFQGFAIAAKKHFYNTSALRVGIGLKISAREEDKVTRMLPADTTRQTENLNSDVQSIDISIQYLFYPNPDADINVFFGAGPLLRYTSNKIENERIYNYSSITEKFKTVFESHDLAIGASVLLGVEWFVSKNISFSGEYALSFEYYTAQMTQTQSSLLSTYKNETKNNINDFKVYPLLVKLGLSVYF